MPVLVNIVPLRYTFLALVFGRALPAKLVEVRTLETMLGLGVSVVGWGVALDAYVFGLAGETALEVLFAEVA